MADVIDFIKRTVSPSAAPPLDIDIAAERAQVAAHIRAIADDVERGEILSVVFCGTVPEGVGSMIYQPGVDLYALIGVLEAVKQELIATQEPV